MMPDDIGIKLNETLTNVSHVTIITGTPPYPDALFSLMAWRNVLEEKGIKYTLIAIGLDPEKAPGHIEHLHEIQTQLPVQRTVLKLNLGKSHVKKVSYEEKDGSLMVYVTPQDGVLADGTVERIEKGVETDVLITLGIHTPQEVVGWPEDWPQWFNEKRTLVNIDINSHNTAFGQINVVDAERSSLSELSTQLFKIMDWSINPQTAEYLYRGLVNATRQFKQFVQPETFETAAFLLRNGAQTQPRFSQDTESENVDSEINTPTPPVQSHIATKPLAHPIDL